MNLLQLVMKQMRQRALSSWLTLFSVMLGVALAISIMVMRRESQHLFAQSDFGFEVLVGPSQGSPLQLTLNTIYHMDQSPGTLPYSVYEQLVAPPPATSASATTTSPAVPSSSTADESAHMNYAPFVKIAVPIAVGDSYQSHRIIGTLPSMFGFDELGKPLGGYDGLGQPITGEKQADTFEYRRGKKFTLSAGRMFDSRKFEAVLGSDITARTGLKLGDEFQSTHGMPLPNQTPDVHSAKWKVVGILSPTHTANDRVLYIPLLSTYAIAEHEEGERIQQLIRQGLDPAIARRQVEAEHAQHDEKDHDGADEHHDAAAEEHHGDEPAGHHHHHDHEPYTIRPDGTIAIELPKKDWSISAILVKTRPHQTMNLLYLFQVRQGPSAVNPAQVMFEFFNTFFKGTSLLLLTIGRLVTIVAAVGILVSIYNSVSARMKEIAILRALGATRVRILSLICVEAGLIGLVGGLLGLAAGHGLAAAGSVYFNQILGEGIDWRTISLDEWGYLRDVVIIALAAGLVPALKAYRSPVATHLSGQ